jgi:hypothetical protein
MLHVIGLKPVLIVMLNPRVVTRCNVPAGRNSTCAQHIHCVNWREGTHAQKKHAYISWSQQHRFCNLWIPEKGCVAVI